MRPRKRSIGGIVLGSLFLLVTFAALCYRTGDRWNHRREALLQPPPLDESLRRALGQAEVAFDQGHLLACYRQYASALAAEPVRSIPLHYGHFEQCADAQLREIARTGDLEQLRDFLKVDARYREHAGTTRTKYEPLRGRIDDLMAYSRVTGGSSPATTEPPTRPAGTAAVGQPPAELLRSRLRRTIESILQPATVEEPPPVRR